MGRLIGNRRRVVPFSGRQTCNEQRSFAGFIVFACRARSELVKDLSDLLRRKPPLPTKLRSALTLEVFSLFAQQIEDVCQWLTALKDLPPKENILDAVKNTSINDNDRINLAIWVKKASNRDILNKFAGKHLWTPKDLSDADVAKGVLADGLSELIKPKPGLGPAFPVHIWQAVKHGYVAVYGLKPKSRMVSVLTQGAGLYDSKGNVAVFQIPADIRKIDTINYRVEAIAKAFSWLMGVIYKTRYGKWPEGPPRHLNKS